MRRSRARLLMAIAGLLTLLVTGSIVSAPVSAQDDYRIGAIVIYCDELPEFGPYYASPLCSQASGVLLTFSTPDGEILATCDSGDPNCYVEIPFSSTIVVTLDESTIAAGYALYTAEGGGNPQEFTAPPGPPDGIVGGPFFMMLPVEGSDPVDEEPVATTALSDQPVQIHAGDCDNLGEMIYALNNLSLEEGDPVGDPGATSAMASFSYGIPVFLDTAIDEGYAVAVFDSPNAATPVACGELGGINNHDGGLPVGLQEVNNSGVVGIAYVSYNGNDSSTTDVIVLVSEELLG